MSPIATYDAGGLGSAEIVAYDADSRRLFLVNAATSTVDILDVSDPTQPALFSTIDTSALGSPNSVAVSHGLVALAIQSDPKTDAGWVAFYTSDGDLLNALRAGALPDMLTFSEDGEHLLIANEGEPSGYGVGHVDPEGSVSIIEVPYRMEDIEHLVDANVRTVSFAQFNGQEDALRAQGIRIYGPGATAAQDFEPEYITVAPGGRTAYVTLQENNALAEIDIRTASVKRLLPLGYKDYTEAPHVVATHEWTNLPSIGATAAGQPITLGGFSGLAFEGVTADGKLKFITHTDRGPNGEPTGINRPFVLPNFNPRIVRFTLDPAKGRFHITQQIPLRRENGSKLTGLPNTAISGNANQPYNDEVGVDLFGAPTGVDPLGGDFEGIVVADDGSFWMADEYRPAIYHFGSNGRLIARYIPIGTHAAAGAAPGTFGIEALPAVIGQRRQNRGIEAIALQNGKVYAFVQSPLRNPATLGNAALNAMKNVRVVEFDPATFATRQFLYILDNPALLGTDDTPADKIGDAVAIPGDGFLVVERDDDALDSDVIEAITKKIYGFNLGDATDVSALGPFLIGGVLKTVDQMTEAELLSVGVKPVVKTLRVDLAQAGYANVEKVEGLALLDNGQLALINDDDFGVAQIDIDNATGTFVRRTGYVPEDVELGIVSLPGLDASDRDNAINIRDWPVLGMYEPDAIASFKKHGKTYLVTANEGDARDWPGLSEEARVGALTLDPVAFPNAAALRNNASLGRLNVTRTLGNPDGDADFEELYTLGGRSFTIWTTDGEPVYDSGSDFERIVAMRFPAFFDASNDDRAFDSRSDNKGPEPEGVVLGEIDGRTYAFIGLERMGGVMTYDITTPTSPVFQDYVNNRNFSVDPATAPAAGDLGPEGLIFIKAHDSPTQCALLVVANEVSGTVTLYQVDVAHD